MGSNSSLGCEIIIIGAGITGLSIARELLHRGAEDILILEKENELGAHASGRNSGILHAGIYYTPDTLKAQFCVEGNQLMKAFCRENGLTLKETGKVIVTKRPEELEGLYELQRRAEASGAGSKIIDPLELAEVEPYAHTVEKAIYSPHTAVIQPMEILNALSDDIEGSGRAKILKGRTFLGIRNDRIALTSMGDVSFNLFINAAGTFADKTAHEFGIGQDYKILPFKGTYKRLVSNRNHLVRGSIYPVPDLRNPFLGVHFSRTADDQVYVGPTAIAAFGRENYKLFSGISAESFDILYRDAVLFFRNPGFRHAAFSEPKKLFNRFVFADAVKMVPELEQTDLEGSSKVGIRSQLVHWPSKKLVTDFVLLKGENSVHVLNAISPAFTSSLAFAKEVVKNAIDGGSVNAI